MKNDKSIISLANGFWQRFREKSDSKLNFALLFAFLLSFLLPTFGFVPVLALLAALALLKDGPIGEKKVEDPIIGDIEEVAIIEPTPLRLDKASLLHEQVIEDAQDHFELLTFAAGVADDELGDYLRAMVASVKVVEAELDKDPSRLPEVQRLFTYYLPATADLLRSRGNLLDDDDKERLAEIDTMLGKLSLAYNEFADRLKDHDMRSLEIDMRLLDSALDEDFALRSKG